MTDIEILAPAGGLDSLMAAVRCGADAVYLGGKSFNARRNAANFDNVQLSGAVSFCHVHGVMVYIALNTVVFGGELREIGSAICDACESGADAVIIQDLAVAEMARRCAPSLPMHASTQMSVHNLDGVKALEQMGFKRCVLARELSRKEIEYITARTQLEIECFVHGALCMCMSGQCYLSAMIGGRSGNRGLCAQPCRLPFASESVSYALSLKDLSLVENIRDMAEAGIKSLKIEGRLKRPEYVAAAVTACRSARDGRTPDLAGLRAVFSRSGFTKGYFEGNLGGHMFGTREKDDVIAAESVLKDFAALYVKERQNVPVDFSLKIKENEPVTLFAADDSGNYVQIKGAPPEKAINAPITPERAVALLGKTGGTPFYVRNTDCEIAQGLMSPASAINALRRDALENLTQKRGEIIPHAFTPVTLPAKNTARSSHTPKIRVRLQRAEQFSEQIAEMASAVIIPAEELCALDENMVRKYAHKLYAELPRIFFGPAPELERHIAWVMERGVTDAVAGNLGTAHRAKAHGLTLHGDFGLNIANSLALYSLAELGFLDCTLSFELNLAQAKEVTGGIPTGILAYGYLPLMVTRNSPAGAGNSGELTDRLGNKFAYARTGDVTEIYNMTPLYMADKQADVRGFDFITLYFTVDNSRDCINVFRNYLDGAETALPKTRGLYYRKVL